MDDGKKIKTYLFDGRDGKTFCVIIFKNGSVKIQEHTENGEKRKLIIVKPVRIFFSPQQKKHNSKVQCILLEKEESKLGINEYIYVGFEVFLFRAVKIATLISNMGNNRIAYPYALDINGCTYLMLEKVIMGSEWLSARKKGDDPYEQYYRYITLTKFPGWDPKPVVENFCGIVEFYLGQDLYALTYTAEAEQDYERMSRSLGKPHLKNINGIRAVLTKRNYKKCMAEYGNLMQFQPMNATYL